MNKKAVDDLMIETRRELPLAEKDKPMAVPDPLSGKKIKPFKQDKPHPLGVGVRKAKNAIARILQDDSNIEKLQFHLQIEFDESPTRFLRTYEPLLRRYERVEGTERKEGVAPIKVVTGVVVNTEREQVKVKLSDGEHTAELTALDQGAIGNGRKES